MKRKNIADSRRELMERVHLEGVWHAYQAAEDVCRDKTAPAPARATASATLFRVAGYFGTRAADDADQKPPHELSRAELEARIQRLQADREAADATPTKPEAGEDETEDDDSSVFD